MKEKNMETKRRRICLGESLVVGAAMGLALGCGPELAMDDEDVGTEEIEASSDRADVADPRHGTFLRAAATPGDMASLTLRADRTFSREVAAACASPPCAPVQEGGGYRFTRSGSIKYIRFLDGLNRAIDKYAYRLTGNTLSVRRVNTTRWYDLVRQIAPTPTATPTPTPTPTPSSCTPSERRCTGNRVDECASDGTAWRWGETCAYACDRGACTQASLVVTQNMTLDGEQVFSGPVVVRTGARIISPTGNLTIRAPSIVVESGATIVVEPTGSDPSSVQYGNGDIEVKKGRRGYSGFGGVYLSDRADLGWSSTGPEVLGGLGGGVLKLIATTVDISGALVAEGGPGIVGESPQTFYPFSYPRTAYVRAGVSGAGAGGGILVAADNLTGTGSFSTQSGTAAGSTFRENNGKTMILHGNRPPVDLTSTTHPSEAATYNDDFSKVRISWEPSPAGNQGYIWTFNGAGGTPTLANGNYTTARAVEIDRAALVPGVNVFRLTVIGGNQVSAWHSSFRIQVNTAPATIASTTHPIPGTRYASPNVMFNWTFPVADDQIGGVTYTLDRFADTVPTALATPIPVTQKQLFVPGLAPGVWFFHVMAVDQKGYRTKAAAHYRVDIGQGQGGIEGAVLDGSGAPGSGATVTLNRGAHTMTVASNGRYSFTNITPGPWEIRATRPGTSATSTRDITVTDGATTVADFRF